MFYGYDCLELTIGWMGTNHRANTYKRALALKKAGGAYIFNLLMRECTGRFKWKYNPPDGKKTIATELIELTLCNSGIVGFYNLTQQQGSYAASGWRNFRVTGTNNLSPYGYPDQVDLADYAGNDMGRHIPVQQQDESNIADCALIFDSAIGYSPLNIILFYAERLNTILTRINAAVNGLLGTRIITCTREQARDIQKQQRAADIGAPYVLNFNELDQSKVELMSTPGLSEELQMLYAAYDKTHHDFLQSIGIRVNNEIDRKSGITPIEIVENRMNVDIILNQALEARQRGIELARRVGLEGLSVSLDSFKNHTGDYDANGNRTDPAERSSAEKEAQDVELSR